MPNIKEATSPTLAVEAMQEGDYFLLTASRFCTCCHSFSVHSCRQEILYQEDGITGAAAAELRDFLMQGTKPLSEWPGTQDCDTYERETNVKGHDINA